MKIIQTLIISILLMPALALANYTINIEQRGTFYHKKQPQALTQTQICLYRECLFVSVFEINALNLGLPSISTQEIYHTLTKMTQFERAFIFDQLKERSLHKYE